MSSLNTRFLGFDPQLVDYTEAFALQQQLHDNVLTSVEPSTLLLLEHQDVYTAGKRTEPEDRPIDGTPVIDVDRGGKITWHGRGQLVGYPILKLADKSQVKPYVCALETAIINVLAENYGIQGSRVEGRSGVWIIDEIQDRKIAAIGIRVHRGVTTHGFAVNCSNDLSAFENIIPCGIRGVGTTSISAEYGHTVTPEELAEHMSRELAVQLEGSLEQNTMDQHHTHDAQTRVYANSTQRGEHI